MEGVSLLGVGVYTYCNAYQATTKLMVITSIMRIHSAGVFKELYCSLDVKLFPNTLTKSSSKAKFVLLLVVFQGGFQFSVVLVVDFKIVILLVECCFDLGHPRC